MAYQSPSSTVVHVPLLCTVMCHKDYPKTKKQFLDSPVEAFDVSQLIQSDKDSERNTTYQSQIKLVQIQQGCSWTPDPRPQILTPDPRPAQFIHFIKGFFQ